MTSEDGAGRYDEHYFRHGCGAPYERSPRWLAAFGRIADRIVADIRPRTVLDAGCAIGLLVEALRDRGLEAEGVDISEYALAQARADIRAFLARRSLTEPLPRQYDLVVCIEVLEHLPKPEAETALANLCQAADDVLFSSSPLDYAEATHLNVQPPEYWAEQFARRGFVRDVDFDAAFITPWAARFRRSTEPPHRIVRAYERRLWELWRENQDLRRATLELRAQLVDVEISAAGQVIRRLSRLTVRLAPPGSRRQRWLIGAQNGLRRWLGTPGR